MHGQEELPGAKLLSPEGMEHVRKTIDGIFELFEQVAERIESLTQRIEAIEMMRPPAPKDGRENWFNQEIVEWVPRRPRI